MGTIISLSQVSLSVGSRFLFEALSCSFEHGQRTGLVGRNGSGKSTFLKMLAGHIKPDSGTISTTKNCRIAYLPQEIILTSTKTVLGETCDAHIDYARIKNALKGLEPRIHAEQATEDEIHTYTHLLECLETLQPETLLHKAKTILKGLGFNDTSMQVPVSTLSTGWKMRIVLAQLLLQDADLYLFDEPTNHLDIVAKEWFFDFLSKTTAGYVLVCHDRHYLDNLCTSILSLDQKKTKLFRGSYKNFEIYQQEVFEQQQRAYDDQQKDIQRRQETIDRFRAQASKAKMVQSMIKELERIELLDPPPPQPKTIHIHFNEPQRPGRIVLTVKNSSFSYGEKKLFDHASFQIERNQKVALIAPNGTGKTTLFNLIIGKLIPQKGTIEYGNNVKSALFVQEQATFLNGSKSIWENVIEHCPNKTDREIRSLLGSFLFSGDDIQKKVSILSGGEKNRVGMAITLLQDANFLLLDEPTNHLDIPSKEVLLQALVDYPATIFFVSHDHDFINRLATHIIELTPEGTYLYHGNYESYLTYKHGTTVPAPSLEKKVVDSPEAQPTSSQQEREKRKEIQRLERTIESLEKNKRTLEASFSELVYGTPSFTKAQQQLLDLEKRLEEALTHWEDLNA